MFKRNSNTMAFVEYKFEIHPSRTSSLNHQMIIYIMSTIYSVGQTSFVLFIAKQLIKQNFIMAIIYS